MAQVRLRVLQTLICLVGLSFVLVGLDVGFGGLDTLGLQGRGRFFAVINETGFLVQDSHQRFMGGFFGSAGLFLAVASWRLREFHLPIKVLLGMTIVGGLIRLSAGQGMSVFSPELLPATLSELVLIPVLFIWLSVELRNERSQQKIKATHV